jgi:Bacteriophage lambda head decoration protein D
MPQEFEEGRHAGEAILSEANFHRSRDNIVIPAGTGIVAAGTVLGRITATGEFIPSPPAVVTGSEGAETASAVNIHEVDATTVDVAVAAWTRDAELNGACLEFAAAVDTDPERAAKVAQLALRGMIVR